MFRFQISIIKTLPGKNVLEEVLVPSGDQDQKKNEEKKRDECQF